MINNSEIEANTNDRHGAKQSSNPLLTQHVDRLHKRAQQQQQQQQQQQTHQANRVSQSVLLDPPSAISPHPSCFGQGSISRRASDPVRPLDRNFGVVSAGNNRPAGVHSSAIVRSGSYTTLNAPSAHAALNLPATEASHSNGMQQQQVGGLKSKNKTSLSLTFHSKK